MFLGKSNSQVFGGSFNHQQMSCFSWVPKVIGNKDNDRLIYLFRTHICLPPIGNNLLYSKSYCALRWHRFWHRLCSTLAKRLPCVFAGSRSIRENHEKSLIALWLRCTCSKKLIYNLKNIYLYFLIVPFYFDSKKFIDVRLYTVGWVWKKIELTSYWAELKLTFCRFSFGFLKLLTDYFYLLDASNDDWGITCSKNTSR